jgi:TonB family protein
VYLALDTDAFTIASTDGSRSDLEYEGDAYPLEALSRELAERYGWTDPPARVLFIMARPGVPEPIAGRALTVAREAGFTQAVRCTGSADDESVIRDSAPPASEQGTIGLGNLGTIGEPEGDPPTTNVVPDRPDVRGSLSRAQIQAVVREHLGEVRACYERGLRARPDLEGRVVVSFIISPEGAVTSASVATSEIREARVESCIAQAIRTWRFPAPDGGGVVGVNYPFVLGPG